MRKEHQERVEGVTQEDHPEHLNADEGCDERTAANEPEAVAKRRTYRRRGAGGKGLDAEECQEDEKWNKGERVDEESPAGSEAHDDESSHRGTDDLRKLPRCRVEAHRGEELGRSDHRVDERLLRAP